MPIYEYYCRPCHTIYSFFARSASVSKAPSCPKCGDQHLEKQLSRFAVSRGRTEPSPRDNDPFSNIGDSQMEKLMSEMSAAFGEGGERGEDPRQMASVMRKLFQTTGREPTGAMLEAMERMEAGEDPDQIDEELSDALNAEEPFWGDVPLSKGSLRRMIEPPNVDPALYDL